MWFTYAILSALFAGLTSILAKGGIKNTDSNVATALRTIVVLFFSSLMVVIVGSFDQIITLSLKTWIFLILSGLATGISWLCYFKALQQGDVNKVVVVDKSSTVLTILLSLIILQEGITWVKLLAIVIYATGTYLMINKREIEEKQINKSWLIYAVLSAVFASLTAILAKVGIEGVESNLGTTIRTVVVLIMAWVVVFLTHKEGQVKNIDKKELAFILLSGLATGASWLCYYKALQGGKASVVVPLDKLSLLVTVLFSYLIFKEKLSKKALLGLSLIVSATLLLLL